MTDDTQTEPHLGEVPVFSCWLDSAPVVGEIGSMGGDDCWEVLEVLEMPEFYFVVVNRQDTAIPDRELWLSANPVALIIYLKAGQFITADLAEAPAIGHLGTHPYIVKESRKLLSPGHFQSLFMAEVVAA